MIIRTPFYQQAKAIKKLLEDNKDNLKIFSRRYKEYLSKKVFGISTVPTSEDISYEIKEKKLVFKFKGYSGELIVENGLFVKKGELPKKANKELKKFLVSNNIDIEKIRVPDKKDIKKFIEEEPLEVDTTEVKKQIEAFQKKIFLEGREKEIDIYKLVELRTKIGNYGEELISEYKTNLKDNLFANILKGIEEYNIKMGKEVDIDLENQLPTAIQGFRGLFGRFNEEKGKAFSKGWYVWRTVGDNNVRTEHKAYDNKIYSFDSPPETLSEAFNPGVKWNCRCYAEIIIGLEERNGRYVAVTTSREIEVKDKELIKKMIKVF